MIFYIKKIKLWFKTHSQSKEYTFEKNKVNVVTGDSSTGKSSILRVIDYCLMARESSIVCARGTGQWHQLKLRV